MKRYPVLILAYRRTLELEIVLKSIEQLKPTCVYFHIHNAPNDEAQKEVKEVKKLITEYSTFPKKILYSKEHLGCRASVIKSLQWISEAEQTFYVFEDDIVLKKGASKILGSKMEYLSSNDGVLKFGENREHANFWGWATTANTVKLLTDKSVWDIEEELVAPSFQDAWHYKGTMEAFRQGKNIAWDDEFHLIAQVLSIKKYLTDTTLTEHTGVVTTRDTDNTSPVAHIMFRNGVLVPQENDNA
jgi:GR25 family glycosyltransferase involved in LPS biosynthesis